MIFPIWANYNNSLTWIKAIKGDDFPQSNHDFRGSVAVRSWWNLPSSMIPYRCLQLLSQALQLQMGFRGILRAWAFCNQDININAFGIRMMGLWILSLGKYLGKLNIIFHWPELLGHKRGWCPLLTVISNEGEQWGRYNLPRYYEWEYEWWNIGENHGEIHCIYNGEQNIDGVIGIRMGFYKVVPPFDSVQLVQITPISMVFVGDIVFMGL